LATLTTQANTYVTPMHLISLIPQQQRKKKSLN